MLRQSLQSITRHLPTCTARCTQRPVWRHFIGTTSVSTLHTHTKPASQLSYVRGRTDKPLDNRTISEVIRDQAKRIPATEAVVVIHQNIRKNYSALDKDCDVATNALIQLGLKRGERIGVWLPNCYEWVLLQVRASVMIIRTNTSWCLSGRNRKSRAYTCQYQSAVSPTWAGTCFEPDRLCRPCFPTTSCHLELSSTAAQNSPQFLHDWYGESVVLSYNPQCLLFCFATSRQYNKNRS